MRWFRVWIQGQPDRYKDWTGNSPQEAVIGAAVHLLTPEERQQMPADMTFVAQRTVSVTVAQLDAWIDERQVDSPSELSLRELLRSHLHGR